MAYYYDALIIYEPLVRRRMHESNLHSQYSLQNYRDYISTFQFLFENGMIGKKFLDEAKFHSFYKIGDIYRGKGQLKEARKSYLKAMISKPLSAIGYRRLVSSYVRRGKTVNA
jgi:tetratricopeptide (TPR) repeat protein